MSFAGVARCQAVMNDAVCCPTCDLPAIVKDRIYLHSTDGPVEHLRISCIGGHSWLLLGDRVRHLEIETLR